jgi:8-oxo-dGTP pyrophosphatase MutT (NUDIX family)
MIDASVIILTYQGKILSMLRDDIPTIIDPNMWCFIGGRKEENETFEQAAIRETKEETNIDVKNLTLLAKVTYNDRLKYYYHASLTEKDVQNIVRGEGQKLEFLTMKELEQLPITKSTQLFFDQYRDVLERITT